MATEHYVKQIIGTIKGSNRNLTMDNWFNTIPFAELLLKEFKLSCVGTIRKNKTKIPAEFVDPKYKQRGEGTSMFFFVQIRFSSRLFQTKEKK